MVQILLGTFRGVFGPSNFWIHAGKTFEFQNLENWTRFQKFCGRFFGRFSSWAWAFFGADSFCRTATPPQQASQNFHSLWLALANPQDTIHAVRQNQQNKCAQIQKRKVGHFKRKDLNGGASVRGNDIGVSPGMTVRWYSAPCAPPRCHTIVERPWRVTWDDGTVILRTLRAVTVRSHNCCQDFGHPLTRRWCRIRMTVQVSQCHCRKIFWLSLQCKNPLLQPNSPLAKNTETSGRLCARAVRKTRRGAGQARKLRFWPEIRPDPSEMSQHAQKWHEMLRHAQRQMPKVERHAATCCDMPSDAHKNRRDMLRHAQRHAATCPATCCDMLRHAQRHAPIWPIFAQKLPEPQNGLFCKICWKQMPGVFFRGWLRTYICQTEILERKEKPKVFGAKFWLGRCRGGLGCKLSRPLLKLGTPQTRLLNGAPGPTEKINLGMPCTSAKLLKFHGLAIKWAIFLLKASNAEEKQQKFRSM